MTCTPATFPAPTTLNGVQVEWAGRMMPILKVSPTEVVYQIPWDMPPPTDPRPLVRVWSGSTSPFVEPEAVRAFPTPPEFTDPPAFHIDGLPATTANPVYANQLVDLYATGFQVEGMITGVPAPDPSPPLDGIACEMQNLPRTQWLPMEVLSFGAAPGRAGVFRIRVRTNRGNDFSPAIRCRHASGEAVVQVPTPRLFP